MVGQISVPGVLLFWIIVGQGPSVFAVGAGWACVGILSLPYHPISFSLCLVDGSILTEILSQRAAYLKTTNHQLSISLMVLNIVYFLIKKGQY